MFSQWIKQSCTTSNLCPLCQLITCSIRHLQYSANKSTSQKISVKIVRISFTHSVLLYCLHKNQKFGVFLAIGVKHTTDQREERLVEEMPDGCLWEEPSSPSWVSVYELLLPAGPLILEHVRISQFYSLNHLTDLRFTLACYYLGSRLKFRKKSPNAGETKTLELKTPNGATNKILQVHCMCLCQLHSIHGFHGCLLLG